MQDDISTQMTNCDLCLFVCVCVWERAREYMPVCVFSVFHFHRCATEKEKSSYWRLNIICLYLLNVILSRFGACFLLTASRRRKLHPFHLWHSSFIHPSSASLSSIANPSPCLSLPLSFQCCCWGFVNFTQYYPSSLDFPLLQLSVSWQSVQATYPNPTYSTFS